MDMKLHFFLEGVLNLHLEKLQVLYPFLHKVCKNGYKTAFLFIGSTSVLKNWQVLYPFLEKVCKNGYKLHFSVEGVLTLY